MIRLEYKGMCEGCEYADLELDYIERSYGQKTWSVKCIHSNACDNMETKAIRRAIRGREGGTE